MLASSALLKIICLGIILAGDPYGVEIMEDIGLCSWWVVLPNALLFRGGESMPASGTKRPEGGVRREGFVGE